jgi:rapamycin-insensitive companion of mTOR
MSLIDKNGSKDHILILVLFCLDFAKEGKSREFLQFCLENGSKNLIKAGLDLLRLIYRSEL